MHKSGRPSRRSKSPAVASVAHSGWQRAYSVSTAHQVARDSGAGMVVILVPGLCPKNLIVSSLRLTLPPSEIDDDLPLFGEGLGLDSIDALELVLEIERRFGFAIADEEPGKQALRSVNTIAELIEQRRRALSSSQTSGYWRG